MTRVLLVLLLTTFLTAQSATEVDITAEPHHHLVLANDQVRVFNVDVPPHSETLLHRHAHDYIYVMLGVSEIVNAIAGKDPVTVKLEADQVGFFSGPFAHVVRSSAQPFRNLTIELLQDDKLRYSTAKWDETRGLEILHGGTQEILFVKDNVRVSEFELQPDAMVPSLPHAGPLLLVALNDLDLYTHDPRTHGPPEPDPKGPSHLSAASTIWLRYGFQCPIMNAGHHPAKFVTLEFP